MRSSALLTALVAAGTLLPATGRSQTPATAAPRTFTHADTLRGANGPGRAWWDADFYDLHVRVNPADSSITGLRRSFGGMASEIPAVRNNRIVEIKSTIILQPGPAALTDGLDAIVKALWPD